MRRVRLSPHISFRENNPMNAIAWIAIIWFLATIIFCAVWCQLMKVTNRELRDDRKDFHREAKGAAFKRRGAPSPEFTEAVRK